MPLPVIDRLESLSLNKKMRLAFAICIYLFSNVGCAVKTKKAIMNPSQSYHSITEFRNSISPQLTANQARDLFGSPERDIGSGLYIYVYHVKEGGSITLSFGSTLVSARYFSTEKEEVLFDINNFTHIDFVKIAHELSLEKPSQINFWFMLGIKNETTARHQVYKPFDIRFSQLTVYLDRNDGSKIESVRFQFAKSHEVLLEDLEKKLGKSKAAVIGPSNPGYIEAVFPTVGDLNASYEVTIFGKIKSYEIIPTSHVVELNFRRDKK